MAKYHDEVKTMFKLTKGLAKRVGSNAANPHEVPVVQAAGASAATPPGNFIKHYLEKLPFRLPLRTKDDIISAGDELDKEDLTPFMRGYRKKGEQARPPKPPKPTPLATAVLNYLIQVFQVRHSYQGSVTNFVPYSPSGCY
jgi:hypothetical protein